jgi:signal transduction histidine kinase
MNAPILPSRSIPVITSLIESERDVVLARQRAWQLSELLGFDAQDRTRIATAVSELARNAYRYAGSGRVEYALSVDERPSLEITIIDRGPGIARLEEILRGRYTSPTGMGLGILGARRLMDAFEIRTEQGVGTVVRVGKQTPPRTAPMTQQRIAALAAELARATPYDPTEEVARQNRELMATLDELGRRQEELLRLGRELEDTNRGVVALYAELDEKAERLRQADEIKSRFLSHMSHEFRTPLSSILALSRLLLDRTDGDLSMEQEKQVKFIKQSAQDLSELVNDLLDLAKVEAGKTDIAVERFSVESLIGALRGVMRPLVSGDAVALVIEPPSTPVVMMSDESRIAQILRNLVSNALKFTERGEVRVTVETTDDRSHVVFTVSDTGIGIAQRDIDLIFEEFGQVRSTVQRRVKGTGLGLPLSRRLAEILGGTLGVTSEEGRGSCFTLRLPRDLSTAHGEPQGHVDADGALVECRVLIIDDEVPSRYLLRRLLEEQGCRTIEAASGVEGIEAATSEHPDLILLDLVMPDLSGFQVAERLRQNPDSSDIPLCVVTSKVLSDEERVVLDDQAIPVVAKDAVSRSVMQTIVRQRARRRPS